MIGILPGFVTAGCAFIDYQLNQERTPGRAIPRSLNVRFLREIEAKDVEGLAAEMKDLTSSCSTCHKAHKK
jgi:hypothetical protein